MQLTTDTTSTGILL